MADQDDIPWHDPPPSVKEWWKSPLPNDTGDRSRSSEHRKQTSKQPPLVDELNETKAKRQYYSDKQFAEVIALSGGRKPNFDLEWFRGALERLAWIHQKGNDLGQKIARPYERRCQLKRLRGKLSAFSKALAEAGDDPYINRALNDRARSISHSRVDYIPAESGEEGFEYSAGGEVVIVHEPIQKLVSQLAWFREVIEKAEHDTAEASKADVALYALILNLADLYKAIAADPREPGGRNADTSEFLIFVQKIIEPLGIERSNDALWKIYWRARKSSGAGTK